MFLTAKDESGKALNFRHSIIGNLIFKIIRGYEKLKALSNYYFITKTNNQNQVSIGVVSGVGSSSSAGACSSSATTSPVISMASIIS